MATPSKVQVSLQDPGVFHCPGITPETARKASEVLQENHEKHHIFYGQSGFHVCLLEVLSLESCSFLLGEPMTNTKGLCIGVESESITN